MAKLLPTAKKIYRTYQKIQREQERQTKTGDGHRLFERLKTY